VHSQLKQIGKVAYNLVDPEFDVLPAPGLVVDFGREGMTGCLERQDGPPMLANVGEEGPAGPLGEPGVPVADGNQLQAAVLLERLDHGTQGVDVRDHGPVRLRHVPRQVGADGTAARELKGHVHALQLLAHEVHDSIGIPRRARRVEQLEQDVEQVVGIDFKQLQNMLSRMAVCGNNRSTKRCAVGCGS